MKKFDRFSKHHPKHRKPGEGQEEFGFGESYVDTENLVSILSKVFESKTELEWAIRESTSEGPPHRQLRNALILNQIAKLIQLLNVSEKIETQALTGTSPKEYGFNYPIGIPSASTDFLKKDKQEEAMNWMGEGPYHEVSNDILIMNCLTALTQAVEKQMKKSES